ncbi:unnamed protein product [Lathyrus sativus]|nr:unnamed protein product [Lathyrus sativus]
MVSKCVRDWIAIAYLLTVERAYNSVAPQTQTSCCTGHARLIDDVPWLGASSLNLVVLFWKFSKAILVLLMQLSQFYYAIHYEDTKALILGWLSAAISFAFLRTLIRNLSTT